MAVSLSLLCFLLTVHIESAIKLPLRGSIQDPDNNRVWKRETDVQVTGRPEQGYFIDIFLGSPAQKFSVVVDTGSSNFAIAGSADVGIDKYFISEQSTSFKGSPDKSIKVQYFNGTWQGYFASDIFMFCETCGSGSVDVALITSSSNFFVSPTLWQGILGLGYKRLMQPEPSTADTVLDSLSAKGAVSQVFSIELCGRRDQNTTKLDGLLELNATADESYQYTDLVREWYYQIELTDLTVNGTAIVEECFELNKPHAILDSGTTNLLLPTVVYFKVLAAIESFSYIAANGSKNGVTHADINKFIVRENFLCKEDLQSVIFTWFPEIVVNVAYNKTHQFAVNIPPQQYVRQTMDSINKQGQMSDKTKCYMFGVQKSEAGTILGAAFLERLTVLHDRITGRVGFKIATSCQVSDPVFEKTMSGPNLRTDEGASSCLESGEAPAWLVSVIALSVGAAIVLSVSLWYLWKSRHNICKCGSKSEEGRVTECRAEKRVSVAAVGNKARRMSNVDSGNTNSILAGLQGGEDDVGGGSMDVIEEDEVVVDEASGGLCDEIPDYGVNTVVLESLTGRDVEGTGAGQVGVVNSDEEDMGYESHETLEDQNDGENDHGGVIVNKDDQENAEEKETVEEELEKEEEVKDVSEKEEDVSEKEEDVESYEETQENGESNVETLPLDQQQQDHDHVKEPEEMGYDSQQNDQQKENELESVTKAAEENELESATMTTEENELESVTKAAEENKLESATMTTEENELESVTKAAEENKLESATMTTEENELESVTKAAEENELESATMTTEENELESVTKAAEENELESATMTTEGNELGSVGKAAKENELESAAITTEENESESISKATEENALESVIIETEENELKSITIERGRKESNSEERAVLAALADSVRGTEDSSTEEWDSDSAESQSEEKSKSIEDSDSDDNTFVRVGNNSDIATEKLECDLDNVEVQSPNNFTGDENDDIPIDWND
ncbi:uncharacterized protein LOC134824365 isoform X2 [Bolinopsis microptera]|uniref:uncharacterized protein LOC134824365 isoform X2 n=1 Tax=Bolinopsis microptera TaxID=2820187 RepID=UPI00307A9FF7